LEWNTQPPIKTWQGGDKSQRIFPSTCYTEYPGLSRIIRSTSKGRHHRCLLVRVAGGVLCRNAGASDPTCIISKRGPFSHFPLAHSGAHIPWYRRRSLRTPRVVAHLAVLRNMYHSKQVRAPLAPTGTNLIDVSNAHPPTNVGMRRPQVLLHVPCLGRLAGKYEYHNGPSLPRIQVICDSSYIITPSNGDIRAKHI